MSQRKSAQRKSAQRESAQRRSERWSSIPYDPAGSGYHTFRIPALLATDDVLLAFCEGRLESTADAGPIDIVLRRSHDHGRTWDDLRVVRPAEGMTRGNPVPILDPASGDVVLISVQNGTDAHEPEIARGQVPAADARRIFVQRSDDQGLTWTDAVEITDQVKLPDWGWYATGPCHGLAISSGDHAGRLVVPANHSVIPGVETDDISSAHGGHTIISDDGGRSWSIGFVDDHGADGMINANETTVAERSDGRLVFNTRNHKGRTRRAQAVSLDGGRTLAEPYAECPEFPGRETQASMISPDGKRLLLATVADPDTRRELSAYWSDDGVTWQSGAVINTGPSGYCDLQLINAEQVGILYEAGEDDYREQLRFAVIPIETLMRSETVTNGG